MIYLILYLTLLPYFCDESSPSFSNLSTKDSLPTANTYEDRNVGQRYFYNETTGNLDREINRLDVVTDYEYFDTGEKKSEAFDIYEYNYNVKGSLTDVFISGVNTVSCDYDDNNNLTLEAYANGDSIHYEYDENNNLVKQYHNKATAPYVTYSYNADDELTQKVNTDTDLKYIYGESNKVEVYKLADNSLVQSYTENVTEADEESTYNYTYDENGIRTSKTINGVTTNFDKLVEYTEKLKKYAIHINTCGDNRNSYSKTDSEATFFRMKRDYMGNDQLLPGYNIQLGICDEYIAVFDIKQYASDMDCFVPLMEKFKKIHGFYPKYPVADAGYGSFNNYLYCEEHGMEKYMKFTMFEKESKDEKYRDNPYRAVNFSISKNDKHTG